MKTKIETIKKVLLNNKAKLDNKFNDSNSGDDAYKQINKISFQQNFKLLISHYKNEVYSVRAIH